MGYADQMTPVVAPLGVGLVIISLLAGVLMLLVFRAASNPRAIRKAKRRVGAHLLESRLFGDEPRIVLRAQYRLLVANARYIGTVIVPCFAVAIPFILVFPHLE